MPMLVPFLFSRLRVLAYYALCCWLYNRGAPPEIPRVETKQRRKMFELPMRIVGLAHSSLAVLAGFLYTFDFVSEFWPYEMRLISQGWMIFDVQQQRWLKAHGLAKKSDPTPTELFVHHFVTSLILHDMPYDWGIIGVLMLDFSELPIALVNFSWYWYYGNLTDTRACAILSYLAVKTFEIFRLAGYPLTFLFYVWPHLSVWGNLFNPIFWLWHTLLLWVYWSQYGWYWALKDRTRKYSPYSNIYNPPV